MRTKVFPKCTQLCIFVALICLLGFTCLVVPLCHGQQAIDQAEVSTAIKSDGTGSIVIQAHGELPKPPVFFTASANADVRVGRNRIRQTIELTLQVIQGEAETLSLGINGKGEVVEVQDEKLESWSVRKEGTKRFLDLHLKQGITELKPVIKIRSEEMKLPSEIDLTHLVPGKAIGFDSTVTITFAAGVKGIVTSAEGFAPLESKARANHFQTSTGGQLQLSLSRDGAGPGPVELTDTMLKGQLHPNGDSIAFQLRTVATVTEAGAELTVLSGNAAVSEMPSGENYRLRLSERDGRSVYKLVFPETGTFPVTLDFVAALTTSKSQRQVVDFTVAASAVVPLQLSGFDSNLEFHRDQHSVVPLRSDDEWLGFLPATGRARLQWRSVRETGEGKLFFTTSGYVEAKVGVGLLRQDHRLDFRVLQGELNSVSILLNGPGEILDVAGKNIVAWKVAGEGEERQLNVSLSRPITAEASLQVRSQTPLGAFPVRMEGMRLVPAGAIRHSGYLRLTNLGSVRLEPTGLIGLTQLAPEQFPGEPIQARQVFVYRFPAADHKFEVAADRIQPEVNISQVVLYELAETDRVIKADIELDIREAPIREWNFGIPSDYSVVAVAGASVADYVTASEVEAESRNLKVIFGQDVGGRQLVHLHLEKNQPASDDDWLLPQIIFPEAKTVRGDLGIVGAPGYRIAVGESDLLVERPLSYFPKPMPNLQQAFRIRQPGWTATMQIEVLERSVQSDVFHLYSLSQGTVYGSALINYFITGAPISELRITVPETLGNVMIDGQDVRTWRREGDTLTVSLHQPMMGPYTLLVTFEEKPDGDQGAFQAGAVAPIEVQGERGYIQVVSPMQVDVQTAAISDDLLKIDPLELPAEFRLLSAAPSLGAWQYTERPFGLDLKVSWFEPGTTLTQVVEFSEANSRVSQDGELVTDLIYYVKSRVGRTLELKLPEAPVRLWGVSVDGQPVTARQTDEATLIPLPGGTDLNVPVEVRLRLGKPTVSESNPVLTLPMVFAPVIKTQWNIFGDQQRVLVPNGGTVEPPQPVLRPSGFSWIAQHGIGTLTMIILLTVFGIMVRNKSKLLRLIGLVAVGVAVFLSIATAMRASTDTGAPAPLQVSLPILAAEETVELQVQNMPLWQVNLSWFGLLLLLGGVISIVRSFFNQQDSPVLLFRSGGVLLVAVGILLQRDRAEWFFALLAATIFLLLFMPQAVSWLREAARWIRGIAEKRKVRKAEAGEAGAATTTAVLLLAAMLLGSPTSSCLAAEKLMLEPSDRIEQKWQISHQDSRLSASGTITLTGQPGDQFLLLRAPAVLTQFEGEGLRLTKVDVAEQGLAYVISIPISAEDAIVDDESDEDESNTGNSVAEYQATFEYQLEAVKPSEGVPVLTGNAAIQQVDLTYDQADWEVTCPTAVRIEVGEGAAESTEATVLLGPGQARLTLQPKARDVSAEQTQYFVEASNLYLPGPGVVDGRHLLHVRTSQGEVSKLDVLVPAGLTVGEVSGPIDSWQFDADSGKLKLHIEPKQSQPFHVLVVTQRSLDPLPAEVNLAPLSVSGASGQVGLLAVAFGPDAQPEKLETTTMSAVNLGDFDAGLIPEKKAVLHRVYRYGADGGELALRVAAVDPEVRVASKQVLSLGDERVVLSVNFVADITRAGLFQLSFPLPEGLEVESLSGAALHHWAELTAGEQRKVFLHLNGKTLGKQQFALSLTGTAPTEDGQWSIPRFDLEQATRQTGELVVQPTTGIRLRTVSRQNVGETDPRTLGGNSRGALAFRLLQRDWNLVLGIEKLEPWITGQVLHDLALREGQTRSTLLVNFNVQNASIRSLQVALPITDEDEIKTLRASGKIVSDLIRTAPDSNIWEIQFKRRVVDGIQFRIEYERRGDREDESESLSPAEFPQARQLAYFYAVRTGGRLEIEHDTLPSGWQRADWSAVPKSLREAGRRNAPALTLRAVAVTSPLTLQAKRHALADALKLRVANGALTTVLSPTGDQLTAVELTMQVIQRSSLTVGLPAGSEVFSIFVNDESVHSIRQNKTADAWQFYILPGIDDRTAKVRFVYSVPGDGLSRLTLGSPQLNVPLENIRWNVIAPKGFDLVDEDGNLELVQQLGCDDYNRDAYLSKISGQRQVQAQQAAELLEQANQLLQAGQQSKARWALNSVANQYALDAASNEDARVQLHNLQTQQAIVGLNTRRQRVYLDNERDEADVAVNQQLREAAADNPILQQDQLNFRPQQLSELLRGNTTESNAVLQRIASRLVQHQRSTVPAPQAIAVSLPEEGTMYSFARSVQVAENAPLELDLSFGSQYGARLWRTLFVLVLLGAVAVLLSSVRTVLSQVPQANDGSPQ